MKTRLAIIVEGDTERNFAASILAPHFAAKFILRPINLMGGSISIHRIASKAKDLSRSNAHVSTLVDLYQFTGRQGRGAEELETAIAAAVGRDMQSRFIPYVQKHEFEALVFSDKDALCDVMGASDQQRKMVEAVGVPPEEINHSRPPGHRLEKEIFPQYDKPVDGIAILQKTGLGKMRQQCPRFHAWLARLEQL